MCQSKNSEVWQTNRQHTKSSGNSTHTKSFHNISGNECLNPIGNTYDKVQGTDIFSPKFSPKFSPNIDTLYTAGLQIECTF